MVRFEPVQHVAPVVGLWEISELVGYDYNTVTAWRKRGQLPPPTWDLRGGPVWLEYVIIEWARRTGHDDRMNGARATR